ncbi:hypothetical protein BGZ91_010117 [Linnemannia elongata]|nr:hypothetical protein BGZ91_010117 [Linnemannia elongata]
MTIHDIHPNVQGIRRVYESGPSSSSSETMYLVCHPDPSLNKNILLWDDILTVFSGAVYVRYGATVIPFAKGPDFKNLDPLRLVSIPSVTLDVVVRDPWIEKDLSMDSHQQALPDSPMEDDGAHSIEDSNATTAAVRRNPVGGFVEEAMQNYTHIDNPAALPPCRGPQAIWDDQTSPDNSTQALNSSNKSVEHPGTPEERSSTSTPGFNEMMMKARLGDKHAQYALGEMYKDGRGVQKDHQAAVKWFLKAADKGHADAACHIGRAYHSGCGAPQDFAKAVEWYFRANMEGCTVASSIIGYMFENGQGVPQDYSQAMYWYRVSADQGNTTGLSSVGGLYERGEGVPEDKAKAMKWYKMAADKGDARSKIRFDMLEDQGFSPKE